MVTVTVDDLAFVAADAIARPVNAELRAMTPVMRRLEQAGGDAFLAQLRVNVPLDVGAAVVTGGGALASPLVIHAVVLSEVEPVSRGGVRRATLSALQRARDFDISHLAMAPFGLGAGNLDVDDAARTMSDVIREHTRRGGAPSSITLITESEYEADAFRAAFSGFGAAA
ncbi:MAG: macro domain-containing protein [Gemmatimonadaceae bacterium]